VRNNPYRQAIREEKKKRVSIRGGHLPSQTPNKMPASTLKKDGGRVHDGRMAILTCPIIS
jgi:hypothetical protein